MHSPDGLYISGNYIYIADDDGGLQIVDINAPTSPFLVGSYDVSNYSTGIFALGNYAYIAGNGGDLHLVDISSPSAPSLVGSYEASGSRNHVYVSGDFAYVGGGYYGLVIIDISTPSSPVLIGSYNTPGWANGVYVVGNYAYLADGTNGLQVFDISTPSAPNLVGSYDATDDANDVFVLENFAYLTDGESGLKIFNISTPSSPVLVGTLDTSSDARGICVSGNYAFVADYNDGLKVIDISTPSSPTLIGSYFDPDPFTLNDAFDVYVSGNFAYLADGFQGLKVIDIANPSSPSLLDSYDTSSRSTGVYVIENQIYVGADEGNFVILKTEPEMNVLGDGNAITDGDTDPSTTNYTDFGEADITTGTVDHSFTIENTDIGNLTLNGSTIVEITGNNAADFSVTTEPDSTVLGGEQTTFTIRFDPSDTGLRTATVSIANNDADENPYTFAIKGTGTTPPPAPVATTDTNLSTSGFTANWNATTGADNYRLDVSTVSDFSSYVPGYENLAVNDTSQSVTGLTSGTTYYYRVRAVNIYGTSDNSNIITVSTDVTVTINKTGSGTGTLSQATQTVNYGSNLTVTATPDASSDFAGWSGDASGTGDAVLTNITANKTITATFNLKTFTVTINQTGNGTGTLSQATQTVNYGANLTVTATPDVSSNFAGWSGDASGTGDAVLTNITSAKTITATFNLKTFTVTINQTGNGTGTLSQATQTVNYGANLTVTATPDVSSNFAGWSGDASGTGDAVLTNITSAKTITATFNLKTFTVTINKTGTGMGTLSQATQTVNYGSNLTVTAIPDASSYFSGWSGDVTGRGDAVLTNITSNKQISANFILRVGDIGDIDHDQSVNLGDVIIGLKMLTGVDPMVEVYIENEANMDGKIGMEDVIYILTNIAGVR